MRTSLLLFAFIFVLGTALPAQAQLRNQVQSATRPGPTQLYDSQTPAFSLNKLFSPEHFRMGHSFEMSMGSFGGAGSSLGMYTNSLMWQFSQKLDARVDVSVAQSFSGNQLGQDRGMGQVFIRNAEINYRPTENAQIHFSFRQSPYGLYANPHGYGYRPDRFLGHSPLPPVGH